MPNGNMHLYLLYTAGKPASSLLLSVRCSNWCLITLSKKLEVAVLSQCGMLTTFWIFMVTKTLVPVPAQLISLAPCTTTFTCDCGVTATSTLPPSLWISTMPTFSWRCTLIDPPFELRLASESRLSTANNICLLTRWWEALCENLNCKDHMLTLCACTDQIFTAGEGKRHMQKKMKSSLTQGTKLNSKERVSQPRGVRD